MVLDCIYLGWLSGGGTGIIGLGNRLVVSAERATGQRQHTLPEVTDDDFHRRTPPQRLPDAINTVGMPLSFKDDLAFARVKESGNAPLKIEWAPYRKFQIVEEIRLARVEYSEYKNYHNSSRP